MSNPLDDLFGFGGDTGKCQVKTGFNERAEAAKGICPAARVCVDKADLAGWLKSFGVACGAVAKSGMCK